MLIIFTEFVLESFIRSLKLKIFRFASALVQNIADETVGKFVEIETSG